MSAISSEEIISILREEIENYDTMCQEQETGNVIWVGDGIATVYGIDHAMYGEIVTFENGEKGMVQDIRKDTIGCILFGKDTGIKEGTKVVRTKKKAGIPVGENFIGRVINALGEPVDGKGPVKESGITTRQNGKRRESWIENLYQYPWRRVFFPLTPCFLSEEDRES